MSIALLSMILGFPNVSQLSRTFCTIRLNTSAQMTSMIRFCHFWM